jgi:hypothetical protein
MKRLIEWLIAHRWLKVYSQGHLYHADGSLYMGRWAVFETRWWSCRLHLIATPDFDRHHHDHPWPWARLILTNGYAEKRPVGLEPAFTRFGFELGYTEIQTAGSFAFRRPTDRHKIVSVMPDTYTLFFYGRKVQWWGFYTPAGKIYWKDYPSCHAALHPAGDAIEERT